MNLEEYNNQKNQINSFARAFVEKEGLMDMSTPQVSFRRRQYEYTMPDEDAIRYMNIVVPYYQMVNIIDSLETEKRILESAKLSAMFPDSGKPNSKALSNIQKQEERINEKLKVALDRFEFISKQRIGGLDVPKHVARFKALTTANMIVGKVNNNYIEPIPAELKGVNNSFCEMYETYQKLLMAIDQKEPGIKKYFNYMSFLREKDSNGVTNRKKIRQFEREHEGNALIANPYYRKHQTPMFDMSRLRAYKTAIHDLPFSEFEIESFAHQYTQRQRHRSEYDR